MPVLLTAVVLLMSASSVLAAELPDNRAYEMVSPVENHDADVYVPFLINETRLFSGEAGNRTRLPFQASSDGDAVTYVGEATTGGQGFGGSGSGDQYLATRAATGGWRKANGEATQVDLNPLGYKNAYYEAFSSDLSVGIVQEGEFELPEVPPLSGEGLSDGYVDLYTHATRGGGSEGAYEPLLKATPGQPTPPHRSAEEFGTFDATPTDTLLDSVLSFAGAAGGVSLFEANDALTPNAVDGGSDENDLYASVGGVLSLVNVLPGGGSEAGASFGAATAEKKRQGNLPDYSNVISDNGSRVYWTDLHLPAGANEGPVFLRENPSQPENCLVPTDACTVPVSPGPARYWTSAEEGKYAFYTEGEGEETELYRFDAEGNSPAETREALTAPGAGVQGVVGASEDGSYVYFVAHGVLSSGLDSQGSAAVAGADNLYVEHYEHGAWDAPVFIATLSERDDHEYEGLEVIPGLGIQTPKAEFGDWQPGLGTRTAEVSPDGESLVFMSSNQDVDGYAPEVNGVRLEEVYVYSVKDGQVMCASCSPDRIPGETGSSRVAKLSKQGGGGLLPPSFSTTFLSSWMSENGDRVFFDSLQPLVPADTNGKPDVYEWERDGSGSCQEAPGCVYLLSGGTSSSASWLAAEDPSGNDAFIVSRADLSPEAVNEEYALYDARVDGVQPVSPPACTGTGCQGVPAPPPTFATPASYTFSGVGNFPVPAPAKAAAKPKAKPLTRAQKLSKALKACKKEAKKKRAACEKHAKKTYGPVKKGAKKK